MLKISMQARTRPDSSLEWQIDFAKRLGLDMIDFHLGNFPRDPEGMMQIKHRVLRAGLPIGYLGSGGGYTGTDAEIAARIESDKQDVDAAVFLGAPLIRLMSGRPKLDDPDPETTSARSAAAFRQTADYAAARGIFVGLQNHPPPAAPRGKDILRMLEAVDRPNVTHIMDTGQWWGSIGADPRGQFDPDVNIYEYMAQTAPHASSVRAKIYRIDSGKEEWLDHARIARILYDVGYNGALCICFEGQGNKSSYEDCMRMAVAHLRQVAGEVYGV